MTRYLEILAIQRPFDFNVDENNRIMFSCNFEAMAESLVDTWEKEIAKLISDASLGTLWNGTTGDMFIGQASVIQPPGGDGPFITLIDTGGTAPVSIHNSQDAAYEKLSLQVVVRGKDYYTARDRALAIWRLLDGQREVTVAA